MLRKLFKYEFKNTAKVMLAIYAVLVIVTALGSILLSTDAVQTGNGTIVNMIATSLMIIYVLSLFALFIVTYIYMCIHFYKTMYSEQGYLTHTLPVTPAATFNVKFITAFVWMLCSLAMSFLSVLLLLTGASRGQIWTTLDPHVLSELSALKPILFFLPASLVLSCFNYLLLVFASMSIGQLFQKYKVAAAVIAGVILYFITQIVGGITVILASLDKLPRFSNSTDEVVSIFSPFLTTGLLITLLFGVIYYIICIVIVRKHINLD